MGPSSLTRGFADGGTAQAFNLHLNSGTDHPSALAESPGVGEAVSCRVAEEQVANAWAYTPNAALSLPSRATFLCWPNADA